MIAYQPSDVVLVLQVWEQPILGGPSDQRCVHTDLLPSWSSLCCYPCNRWSIETRG